MLNHYHKAVARIQAQTLYVVATPIGNLSDITLHALAVLGQVDLVCAEDTRVTQQLLAAYGIQRRLLSVREHNEQQMADKVIAALAAGQSVAQVSDAGTPAVCDPGAKLAARVRAAGFRVVPVAGPSAVMAALSVAGITQPDFYFAGFLPPKPAERHKRLAGWQQADYPVVMFETPHRIADTLAQMQALYPERGLFLAREISKTFEAFLSGSVAEVAAAVAADANHSRGEMVLVLAAAETTAARDRAVVPAAAQAVMRVLLAELPTKQAAGLAAQISGVPKKALYDWAVAHKQTDAQEGG